MAFKRYEDILAWQQARTLVSEIYNATVSVDTLRRDIRLTDRLQSTSVAIMSHIAKGFATQNPYTFIDALKESLSSASELQSLLYICADLERIDRRLFDRLYQMVQICIRMLSELIALLTKKVGARPRITSIPNDNSDSYPQTPPPVPTRNYSQSRPVDHRQATRRHRAYQPPQEKREITDTDEIEKPDIVSTTDFYDVLNPPEYPGQKQFS